MIVYLISRETGELLTTYHNVTHWAENFVEYDNGGRAKSYCDIEKEYFTDIKPTENVES